MASELKVGSKVNVIGKLQLGVATVKFVGTTQFQSGTWIGIELEVAEGKNDGSVQNVRYFTCQPNFGLFVRENQISIIKPEKPEKKTISSPNPSKLSLPAKSSPSTKTPSKLVPSKLPSKIAASPIKDKEKETTSTTITQNDDTPSTPTPGTTPIGSNGTSPMPSPRGENSGNKELSQPKEIKDISPSPTPSPTLQPKEIKEIPPSPTPKDKEPNLLKEIPVKEVPLPTPSDDTLPTSQIKNESMDKLMRALKELNEFKIKAQENIRALQLRMKDQTSSSEATIKQLTKEKEEVTKELEKMKKDGNKDRDRLNKEYSKERESFDEQIAALNEALELVTLDKEIAEQKAEQFEIELEQMKAEMGDISSGQDKKRE